LQLQNTTSQVIGLDVWLSETHLHGMLWTDAVYPETFKVRETDHCFYRRPNGQVYRRNKLFKHRIDRCTGQLLEQRLITENDSRVLYEPSNVEILEL
jgi:vancomycin resistance protein VanW